MHISTTHEIPGRSILEPISIVTATKSSGINIIKDTFAKITDVVGGQSGVMNKAIDTQKENCVKSLVEQAEDEGADGIIGLTFEVGTFGEKQASIFVSATATAVKLDSKA